MEMDGQEVDVRRVNAKTCPLILFLLNIVLPQTKKHAADNTEDETQLHAGIEIVL